MLASIALTARYSAFLKRIANSLSTSIDERLYTETFEGVTSALSRLAGTLMKKTLAALMAGIALLTALPAEAKEVISSRSIAYNPITEITDLESINSEAQDDIARRDPRKERRIRRRIIRGIRQHKRRQIRRRIIRGIRQHRRRVIRRRIIRGIIGSQICRDRGGYWEYDNCYYDD